MHRALTLTLALTACGCLVDVDGAAPIESLADDDGALALAPIPGTFRDRWGGLGGSGLGPSRSRTRTISRPARAIRSRAMRARASCSTSTRPPDAPYALRSAGGTVLGTAAGDGNHTLGDPWHPAYAALLSSRWAARLAPGDPNLAMYFMGNELGLFDDPLHMSPGVRDLRRYISTDCPSSSSPAAPQCAPHALHKLLSERYVGDIRALNASWGRSFASFDDVIALKPMPGASSARRCDGACDVDMRRFYRALVRQWVVMTTSTLRALDPDHLIASPRMAVGNDSEYCCWTLPGCRERYVDGRDVARDVIDPAPFDRLGTVGGVRGFDVVAINVYSRPNRTGFDAPWFADGIHKVTEESGLPMIISSSGCARASTAGAIKAARRRSSRAGPMRRRGAGTRTRTTWGSSSRSAASDRFDDEDQMNMGIVHRDGSRWTPMDRKVRAFQRSIHARIRDETGL